MSAVYTSHMVDFPNVVKTSAECMIRDVSCIDDRLLSFAKLTFRTVWENRKLVQILEINSNMYYTLAQKFGNERRKFSVVAGARIQKRSLNDSEWRGSPFSIGIHSIDDNNLCSSYFTSMLDACIHTIETETVQPRMS